MEGKLLRLWQRTSCWSITLEGEITWWSGDDVHLRKRKIDKEIQFPMVLWRPYCWKNGHENYYGACIYCDKILSDKKI